MILKKKVYLHDTDCTGIVYYSKYLEWFEEARVELIEVTYKPLTKLIEEDNVTFLPLSANIDFLATLKFDDKIIIEINIKELNKFKVLLEYKVTDNGKVICLGETNMLCINATTKRPVKIPEKLLNNFKKVM